MHLGRGDTFILYFMMQSYHIPFLFSFLFSFSSVSDSHDTS